MHSGGRKWTKMQIRRTAAVGKKLVLTHKVLWDHFLVAAKQVDQSIR